MSTMNTPNEHFGSHLADPNMNIIDQHASRTNDIGYPSFSCSTYSNKQPRSRDSIFDAEIVSSLSDSASLTYPGTPFGNPYIYLNTDEGDPLPRGNLGAPTTDIIAKNPPLSSAYQKYTGDNENHGVKVVQRVTKRFTEVSSGVKSEKIPTSLPDKAYISSSSSGDILDSIRQGPSFPCQPTYPPRSQVLTPPGLPSFGTEDAQILRLTPSSRPGWLISLFGAPGLRRPSQNRPSTATYDSVSSHNQDPDLTSRTLDSLRRALGLTTIIPAPNKACGSRRARLPPGITTANIPGALIRAEDGSFVQGRFGNRVSGHGIGTRPLEFHPLALRMPTHDSSEQAMNITRKSHDGNGEVSQIMQRTSTAPPEFSSTTCYRDFTHLQRPRNARDEQPGVGNRATAQTYGTSLRSELGPRICHPLANDELPNNSYVAEPARQQFSVCCRSAFSHCLPSTDAVDDRYLTNLTSRGTQRSNSVSRNQGGHAGVMQEPGSYMARSCGVRRSLNSIPATEETTGNRESGCVIQERQESEKSARTACDTC